MSTTARARRFELEAAERRVSEQLKRPAAGTSQTRRVAVLVVAGLLFAATFVARVVVPDPDALLANFYVVPAVVLATEFGVRAGLVATAISVGLVFAWGAIDTVHVAPLGYVSRGAVVLIAGVVVGRFSERLRVDIAERQHAQRELSLYAVELERANQNLARTVEQLEAFAEIARAVGGETDLERVLTLILEHGRELVGARRLVLYLPEGEELAAFAGSREERVRLPIDGSPPGEVLRTGRPRRDSSSSILVPLVFRGETLGVLAGINDTDGRALGEEDEQLLTSVAASAATAVATARSVAAARLRLSVEAADQARARWARELHDETLQGLTGARMVLSAARAREDPDALRGAADTVDAHLGEETRKLRDLIAELRPAALDDLGLGPAIESLAKRQAALGGFTSEVALSLDARERLPRDTETAIYRIVQEALSNAVKHAGARRVRLRVAERGDAVEVEVSDDGHGFDPEARREGFGLPGMRERAVLAGGRLAVALEGRRPHVGDRRPSGVGLTSGQSPRLGDLQRRDVLLRRAEDGPQPSQHQARRLPRHRPLELGDVLLGREQSRALTAPDEQHRGGSGLRDRRPCRPEALLAPPVREAEHEQARVARCVHDALPAARHDQRLGRDARRLLHEQAGVREHPGDRLALVRLACRAEQLERRAVRRRDPRAELERGPVVLGAAERDEHGAGRADVDRVGLARHEHGHVTRGVLEQLAHLAHRHALAEQGPASVGEDEIDRLALDDVHEIRARVAARERDAAGHHALGAEPRADLVDRLRGALELQVLGREPAAHAGAGAAGGPHQARDDELARWRGPGQRLGQPTSWPIAPSVCGATRIERSGTGSSGWARAAASAASANSSSMARPYSFFGSSSFSSGPAISVVTTAMITSIANSVLEIAPASRARLSTISSVRPRVFISVPITAEARQS